jgi:hypothetical protein
MTHRIERFVGSVTEDRRTDYLFPTKAAADAVGCHPNKYGDWWRRTREKLTALAVAMPAETAAELMGVLAQGAAERERRRL